jgi:4-hydroxybenzoate polyprenyltransferase
MARTSPNLTMPDAGAASTTAPSLAVSLLVSLRPSQWTKNLLVFAALVFAVKLFDARSAIAAAGTFVVFCALSSAVYLSNDIADRESDRQHPLKRSRPIASGALPVPVAGAAAAGLAAVGLAGAFAISAHLGLVAIAYLVLQFLYSGPLKHVVILDVLTVALGFVLRAIAGAEAIEVSISHWLLVCTILLALFIVLAKRRHELVLLADDAPTHRPILGEYSPYLLDQMIAIVAAAALVAYILYATSPETTARFGTPYVGLTIPFPIYGIFRYLYLVHRREGGGSPADLLLSDRPLLACVALWMVTVVLIVYWGIPGL